MTTRLTGKRAALYVVLTALSIASSFSSARERRAPVIVAEVQEQPLMQQLQLIGTVTAERAARLSMATTGLVSAITVDAGDRVANDDVLIELDDELVRYQQHSAQAAELQARSALQDAQRRLEEARSLAPQRSIAESVVRDLSAEVLEDKAALQAATAQANYQRGLLERHRLRAPFSGVISARHTELGQWVVPGTPVLELVAIDRLRIDVQVPEDYLGIVTDQTQFSFTLAADRNQQYPARLTALVPVTDPGARTFLMRVEPAVAIPEMRPGMSARVNLSIANEQSGIVVPRDAVLRLADGRTVVWEVLEKDGQPVATERVIKPGLRFDGMVEIVEGLHAGTRVVVRGNESLREGQLLDVTPAVQR